MGNGWHPGQAAGDPEGPPPVSGSATDLELVPVRHLIESPVDAVFALSPGDRAIVEAGASVVVGAPIAERLRDPRLEDKVVTEPVEPRPGDRWHALGRVVGPGSVGTGRSVHGGEYLFPWRTRWRVATGDIVDPLETPVAGIVREVRSGTSITMRAAGRGIRGVVVLGGPTRGRLALSSRPDGGLRAGGLDVGMAGSILVVDARVDAETLTRARAMGVRGIIVPGWPARSGATIVASEARQRAALHRLPSFAVLVMDGAMRRPMATPVTALLAAMAGREVAIVADPADARLRRAGPRRAGPAAGPGPDPGGCVERSRGPLARPGGTASLRRRRRPRGGPCPPVRRDVRWRSRSATWNGSSSRPSERHRGHARCLRHSATLAPMPATTLRQRHLTSPDPDTTSALGASLADVARAGDLLCLWGDLGAGKTHLAKAFGAALGVRDTITSPSFVLMAEYEGRLPMFHVDLYRLADAADVLAGGLIDDRWVGGVTLVEWPERLGEAIPPERLDVVIDGSGDEPREIELIAHGERHRRYLEALG